ncbi:unnamed protein product [Closterium sp. NIES-53]
MPQAGCSTTQPPTSSLPLRMSLSTSRPVTTGVAHTECPIPIVSGGAVAEGEGIGTAGARRASSGGAGGVRVETIHEEDTAVSTQRPHPASPPGFPSVPQFPPRSPPRPVAAEPGGVLAGGTGVRGGVVCGGSGSGGRSGSGLRGHDSSSSLSQERVEEESWQQQQHQQQKQSQSECQERVEEESRQQQQQNHQQQQPQSERRERVEEEPRLPQQEPGEQQGGQVPQQQSPEEAEKQRLRSLSSSQWTRRSPLSHAMSPEPRRSLYRADGPFPIVLRSRIPPPHVLPQPPESSLTVFHDPLSDYLRASRPVVSSVLSTGPASSLFSGRAPVFPLEVLEDRQFELGFLAATVPHLYAMLLAREGDTDALDIPITCNHAEAVSGPWAPYWIAAEEAEMASYRSTGTYVDAVPPPRANVVSGMWLYKVKRLPGAPPMFKARYVVRGFSQREGLDFFQTFAPTPKMTTLWVLLHIAVQRDYELHSLDFSTAFLHEQIWLRRPHGFTSSFPPGTQWQLPLDFFPSSADPSLFVRRGSTPFFVLVYVDDLVFATPDRHALASVKEELQRRHTCTDLGELQCYLGLQITRDRAARTITLTYVLARFVAPQRHRPSHWYAAKRVVKYVAIPSGMGIVLGGKQPVTLTGYSDSSWAGDVESLRCEVELYAAAIAAQELQWLSFLLTDLGERPRSPRHIQLRYFLLREFQQRGQARVVRVISEANTADIFTKALPPYVCCFPQDYRQLEYGGLGLTYFLLVCSFASHSFSYSSSTSNSSVSSSSASSSSASSSSASSSRVSSSGASSSSASSSRVSSSSASNTTNSGSSSTSSMNTSRTSISNTSDTSSTSSTSSTSRNSNSSVSSSSASNSRASNSSSATPKACVSSKPLVQLLRTHRLRTLRLSTPDSAPSGSAPPGSALSGLAPPESAPTGSAPPLSALSGSAPPGSAPVGLAPPDAIPLAAPPLANLSSDRFHPTATTAAATTPTAATTTATTRTATTTATTDAPTPTTTPTTTAATSTAYTASTTASTSATPTTPGSLALAAAAPPTRSRRSSDLLSTKEVNYSSRSDRGDKGGGGTPLKKGSARSATRSAYIDYADLSCEEVLLEQIDSEVCGVKGEKEVLDCAKRVREAGDDEVESDTPWPHGPSRPTAPCDPRPLGPSVPGPSAPATATATAATAATAPTATAATTAATAAAATTAPACCATMASLRVLVFDHEGRPIQFDMWLDDLQLYLQSNSKDSVSLFDLASGAAPVPPATADTQALYDAVLARYSLPATAALGRLLLPYLFPELSAFATVEDLVFHLRTSDARYRAFVPAEDHFLSLDLTSLTLDLLEQHLIATETSAVAVGAARGTPRPPFFEGCSPPPLAPSYASAAAADVPGAKDVGAASASAKRRSGKGKGSRGAGGGSGSGGGGSSGGSGGSGGGGSGGSGGGSGGVGGGGGGSSGSGGSGGGGTGGGRTGAWRGGFGGGQRQQQQCWSETQSPQQLREWLFQRGTSGGSDSCPYVIRTGDRAGQAPSLVAVGLALGVEVLEVATGSSSSSVGARPSCPSSFTCGKLHTKHRCFSRLDDAWCAEFGDDIELPCWADLLRSEVAIFDLDFDALLSAMYALSVTAEGDCYWCVPPDPGIAAAALGASESGTLLGIVPAHALHTFTVDSSASRCFFRDSTTLTPLPAPIPVRLGDPSGDPVVARSCTC